MLKPLLIEIGVEELPAIPLLKELPNIEKNGSIFLRNIILKQALVSITHQEDLRFGIENFLQNNLIQSKKSGEHQKQ